MKAIVYFVGFSGDITFSKTVDSGPAGPWPAGSIARTISTAGWALSLAGSLSMGHRTLFGLKPAWDYFLGRPEAAPQLRTSWLYARLRHPMNLGFLIGVAIGVRYEERDLEAAHGPAYAAYRKNVPWLGFSAWKR